jgi:hypothetical protein
MAKFLRLTVLLLVSTIAHAQARFDLTGPKIDVRVTRKGVSLPIAQVPNLAPGDQIWLHPALPSSQSVHYLLIAAFLRGTTNPPPDEWFTRIETWNKKVREEGVTITVPEEAQQVVLFLAPETGGDYSTLKSAVRGRPGIFVRASQDLSEAGFEQARIEEYLREMAKVPPGDAAALLQHSNLLARTLNLKPNPDCFKRPIDQQYNCLTQTGSTTLLDDGHGQTIAAALSNGPSSDFIAQASTTQIAGGGMYSAYVGAIVDLVRLTSGLHTAQFQYIPAIAFPSDVSLNLRLNTPPSFHNPKSVLVIGLPAIQTPVPPPLRTPDPSHISCLLQPSVAIPVEGAPLVFSTSFAHQLVLHLNASVPGPDGKPLPADLPLVPDAFQGGLTIAPPPPPRKELPAELVPGFVSPTPVSQPVPALKPGELLTGTIQGMWGFDPFTGPTVPLQGTPGSGWRIVTKPDTPENLIAGQPNHLELVSSGTACIESILLQPGGMKVEWKLAHDHPAAPLPNPDQSQPKPAPLPTPDRPVDLTLNLQHAATPGTIQLAIQQYGQPKPDEVGTRTFSEPARIEALALHEGDRSITINGTSLGEVKQLSIDDLTYSPEPNGNDRTLTLSLAGNAKPPRLKDGDRFNAKVTLLDGRSLDAYSTVLTPRPHIRLISKRVAPVPPAPATATQPAATAPPPSPILLSTSEDLPLGSQLIFFLKSEQKFSRNEQIEIASPDDSLHTTLSIANNTLVLQDSHTVLGKLDPLKTFGTSAFGPLRLRAVAADGSQGEWIPLATLVRLPTLTDLECPADPTRSCLLDGSDLYLIDSVATDPSFAAPTTVPEGFVETTLAVPHPGPNGFFLRLRDDPTTVQSVNMLVEPIPGTAPNSLRGIKISSSTKGGTKPPLAPSDSTPAAAPTAPPPQ